MRTNKNCPKYGEDPEIQVEATDLEKPPGKSTSLEPSGQSQSKIKKKKLMTKSATKIAVVEAYEGEKSSSNAKALPLKFKCSTDWPPDKLASGGTQSSDHPVISDPDNGIKSVAKVSKIIISNRAKPDEMQVESHKLPIVIRHQVDTDRGQAESHKKSIVIRPPTNMERDQVDPHKPSVVIRPPADKDREQAHKKIIIKRPKEIIDLDQICQEGGTYPEYRKTKKIVELSSFEKHGKQESLRLTEPTARRKAKEERRWWKEEEKRRNVERLREDRARKLYEEEMRLLEERERFAEITRYTEDIRREREEEERQKAKKKKAEIKDDYLEDYRTRRNDRRMPERDRGAKRKTVELGQYGAEYVPPTKRRRGNYFFLHCFLLSQFAFAFILLFYN